MELVYGGRTYDTESDKDMSALQGVLDRIDLAERVKKKAALAAVFKPKAP